MGKFNPTTEDPKALKISLLTGITLMIRADEFVWAEYSEIPKYLEERFLIFNDTKRSLYKDMMR